MRVWVNGEKQDALGAGTIAELAARFGLAPHTILIEHNGVALHQREWAMQTVNDGDRIELVRVVAGG